MSLHDAVVTTQCHVFLSLCVDLSMSSHHDFTTASFDECSIPDQLSHSLESIMQSAPDARCSYADIGAAVVILLYCDAEHRILLSRYGRILSSDLADCSITASSNETRY